MVAHRGPPRTSALLSAAARGGLDIQGDDHRYRLDSAVTRVGADLQVRWGYRPEDAAGILDDALYMVAHDRRRPTVHQALLAR